jgi:ABC-2 type transporter
VWFGCSNAAREIVGEWAVFSRERMVGLRLSAYLLSKITVLGLIGLLQCVLLLAIIRYGCRIYAPWPELLEGLFLSALVGTSLGLLISAVARSSEVAISLVPLAILPMVMLGGVMQPVFNMKQPAQTLAHVMPSRWAFELAVDAEAHHRPAQPEGTVQPAASKAKADSGGPDLAEPYIPSDKRAPATTCLLILSVHVGLFLTGTLAVLRSRDVHL